MLINANVLKDRRVIAWKSIIQEIKNSGANYINKEVVEDNNLISSRSPRDLPAFIDANTNKLK